MRVINILTVLFAVVLLSSCSISNEVHFNKKYSGSYKGTVDFSDAIEMLQSLDQDDDMADLENETLSDSAKTQFEKMLNDIEGVSNANMEMPNMGKMVYSFDFDDVESLNKAYRKFQTEILEDQGAAMMGEGTSLSVDDENIPDFNLDGKTITHSASFPQDAWGDDEASAEEVKMELDMLSSMIDMTYTFSFDKKIKDVKLEGMDLLSREKKVVKTRLDMEEVLNGGKYSIEIKN